MGFLVCAAIALLLVGCASPPQARTTFLNSVDLVSMTDQMAASLARDERITERTPQSDRWVFSLDRVVNHTNQIIPDREKWLYLVRLRSLLAQTDVSKAHNIIWVVPPERWTALRGEVEPDMPPELRERPTHLVTAEFYANTNTSGTGRSDAYFTSFQLLNLESGSIVWEDSWEVKRAVAGRTYD